MDMFCYQCEQTIGGKGCTKTGVCGKTAETSDLQDILINELKQIGFYGQRLAERGVDIENTVNVFIRDALFATLTNVNFVDNRFINEYLPKAKEIRNYLKIKAGIPYQVLSNDTDENVRSLKDLLLFGLKGMAAYAHHAYVLGMESNEVDGFFYKALDAAAKSDIGVKELFGLIMELGRVNLKCMEVLDRANTGTYGDPEPTYVNINRKKGPFIVVSGHDLKDLKDLLEQSEGTGVNIYTHGEMLPAHSYPELKKHSHLTGNYGGAWQDQQKEFDNMPGCILMTTNCLQKPKPTYKDRIFTTGLAGWPDVRHIPENKGRKDYSEIIAEALELKGFAEDEPEKKILVGFGRNAVLSRAGLIIDAVKTNKLKHFFLIGGCDGAKPGRNYYTEFAEKVPEDSVIMTLACGKYRFNKLDFGMIGDTPRLLDIGQCNDAYSAVKIALALKDAFGVEINMLPLSFVLSWYEQKAVCVLITLLSLGIRKIYLGPTLPAFISPEVFMLLKEKFDIRPITDPDKDLKDMLCGN